MGKKNESAEKTTTARITSNTARDVAALQEALRHRSSGNAPEPTGALRAAMDRAAFVLSAHEILRPPPPVSQVLEIASGLLRAVLEEQGSAAGAEVKPLDRLSHTLRALVRHKIPGFTPVLVEAAPSNVGEFLDEISSDQCYAALSSHDIASHLVSANHRPFAVLVAIERLPSLAAHPAVHQIVPMIGDTQSPEVIEALSSRGISDADLRAIPSLEQAGRVFEFFDEEALEQLLFTVLSVRRAQQAAARAIEPKKDGAPDGLRDKTELEPLVDALKKSMPEPPSRYFPSGTVMYGAPPFNGWRGGRGALEATMSGPRVLSGSSSDPPKGDPTKG